MYWRIVAHLHDYEAFCGGREYEHFSSEVRLCDTADRNDALEFLVKCLTDRHPSQELDITFFHDDSEVEETIAIEDEARLLAGLLTKKAEEERKERELKEQEAARQREKERLEQSERKMLAHLQAKYGNS